MRNYHIMFENSKEGVPVLMVFESNNSIFGMSSSPFNIIALHTGDDATRIWNEMTAKPLTVSAVESLKDNKKETCYA